MVFQIGAALLDACVLAVLSKGDAYGYILTQNIKEVVTVSDSTLYPVLRRLEKGNLLESYNQPFEGRNRKYYRITQRGTTQLEHYRIEWKTYAASIDKVLSGGLSHE